MRDSQAAPVGVRPIEGGRLRWVDPGDLTLALGDRVAVQEAGREWLGEVLVPSERLVEWAPPADLPRVSRRVPDAEWPGRPATDGGRVLASLGLPRALLAPGQADSSRPGAEG